VSGELWFINVCRCAGGMWLRMNNAGASKKTSAVKLTH